MGPWLEQSQRLRVLPWPEFFFPGLSSHMSRYVGPALFYLLIVHGRVIAKIVTLINCMFTRASIDGYKLFLDSQGRCRRMIQNRHHRSRRYTQNGKVGSQLLEYRELGRAIAAFITISSYMRHVRRQSSAMSEMASEFGGMGHNWGRISIARGSTFNVHILPSQSGRYPRRRNEPSGQSYVVRKRLHRHPICKYGKNQR